MAYIMNLRSIGWVVGVGLLLFVTTSQAQEFSPPQAGEFSTSPSRRLSRPRSRPGDWVCRPAPPPRGEVITATGWVPSCDGACGGQYAEPLRPYMIICAGQAIPEHYDLVGTTTSESCKCIAGSENASVIQLEKGYKLSIKTSPTGLPEPEPLPEALSQ